MYDTFKEKEQYNILMHELKLQNKEYIQIKSSQGIQNEILKEKIKYAILHFDVDRMKRYLEVSHQMRIGRRLEAKKNEINVKEGIKNDGLSELCQPVYSNYFSKDRIAVYTAMFGDYDIIREPLTAPDNVDFYLITDNCNINKQSKWALLNTDKWEKCTRGFGAGLKNRWYKTHPHLLFPEYKCSLYVDASVKIVTDVTEHINKIGEKGIAIHKHPDRDCVYDELEVVKIFKKDNIQNLIKIEGLYKDINFPRHYGLLENTVIARRHNDNEVICIMEDWWKYIESYSKRDQLSLPVALYNNNVKTNEVCLLGDNVKKNYAFRWEEHIGFYEHIKNDNG